ncbi:MAG: hypothetical protein CVV27_01220 [Candidatus Melainabacteria bacterium HGW-Melainabacteria-1]|nr:MAG: hypothetical protein CVV27_01220 [Candidatus Melainabacteria bacterium HGW-Melainabacteria-1]
MGVLFVLSLMAACDTPDTPLGASPSTVIPSESPDQDPLCLQTLQCIVDNTSNNGLRKQTQEVISELFLVAEPDYSRICLSRADELVERVPECQKQ